jgi:hypothetical protein
MNRPLTPLKSVRAYCLWCSLGSSPEVRRCARERCALWPYRHGHNPKKARTGLTATYTVDTKMTARRAIHLYCRDCNADHLKDCHSPDCVLYDVRYSARLGAKTPSGVPSSDAGPPKRLHVPKQPVCDVTEEE